MRVCFLALLALLAGALGEVEYETEPVITDNAVNRDTDAKSGLIGEPAYMSYAPQCNIHSNYLAYCAYRLPGLYTYTADYNCYIQCDEWHRTFILPCAYGTYWRPDGYEPTTYNRCVGRKAHEHTHAPPPPNTYRSAAPKPDPFTVTRKIVQHETTSYGAQGEVAQKGQVQQHVHVHQNPSTAASVPYSPSPRPLQYNNLVDMYISGKPAHYARKAAETKSMEIQTHPVSGYTVPPPRQAPVTPPQPQLHQQPQPQVQALPQIHYGPPQAPPRPQALPVVQSYQQAPQALPQTQQAPQAYAQPQQQSVQLVAQSIPVRANSQQQQNPQSAVQQQNPNLSNRITLNSRFAVAGHQNTKKPLTTNNINTRNLVSNNSPGINPRGTRLGLGNQVRRPGAQGNRRPRRPINRALMTERRRRLAQWQKYLRQSKQQQQGGSLNGGGGGDKRQLTTAQRRRRLFNRYRLQKQAPSSQDEDIVNSDSPAGDVVNAAPDMYESENQQNGGDDQNYDDTNSQNYDMNNKNYDDTNTQGDDYENQYDDDYDSENYIADDQANNIYEDDHYESIGTTSSEASFNVPLTSVEKRSTMSDEENSLGIQLTSPEIPSTKAVKSQQLFVINNAPRDAPDNLPK